MGNFDDYLRQGEPDKAEKAKVWKTAIGLQQVDGLKPSEYLIETAKQNIEGDITIDEVKKRIDSYYQQHPTKTDEDRTEEADKVSVHIAEMLSEQTFTFSPAEYLAIHRRLFKGIYKFAGKIRDYNITKKEWVLNGETVLYASADSLKATLEYDFEQLEVKRIETSELHVERETQHADGSFQGTSVARHQDLPQPTRRALIEREQRVTDDIVVVVEKERAGQARPVGGRNKNGEHK
ncbi:MAG: hypothetical protein MUF24_07765, partial [Chitinophagaceae bacterium]|nr:hypothetical protein [Chitinophagaceae bacterium]